MEEIYKDFTIRYSEFLKEFTVRIGGSDYQNPQLSAVKKYIDRLDKKDFKRIDVIVEDYKGMTDAIVTSYPDGQEQSSYKECWVSFKEKRAYHSRIKIHTTSVFLDTPDNRKTIAQMDEKQTLIQEITIEISELRKTLETYKQKKDIP